MNFLIYIFEGNFFLMKKKGVFVSKSNQIEDNKILRRVKIFIHKQIFVLKIIFKTEIIYPKIKKKNK